MKHVLDFFGADDPLRDEWAATFPRPVPHDIEAVTRAYRDLLVQFADRTFTPKTVVAARLLHELRGGPNRALVEAALSGDASVTGLVGEAGDRAETTVVLRQRSQKQQESDHLPIERAFDALRAAVVRFDREHPGLAAQRKALFLANDRAAYDDLCRLAITPIARSAASGILGALGKTAKRQARAGAKRAA